VTTVRAALTPVDVLPVSIKTVVASEFAG